jgi:hypothetical protein
MRRLLRFEGFSVQNRVQTSRSWLRKSVLDFLLSISISAIWSAFTDLTLLLTFTSTRPRTRLATEAGGGNAEKGVIDAGIVDSRRVFAGGDTPLEPLPIKAPDGRAPLGILHWERHAVRVRERERVYLGRQRWLSAHCSPPGFQPNLSVLRNLVLPQVWHVMTTRGNIDCGKPRTCGPLGIVVS